MEKWKKNKQIKNNIKKKNTIGSRTTTAHQRRKPPTVGKIAEKAVWRSVFLTGTVF